MSTAKGADVRFMLIEEATWGTIPATPAGYVLGVSSLSGDWAKQNHIDNPELRANRNPQAPVRGNVIVNGSAQIPLHMDSIGWILKHGIGEAADVGTAAPYAHTSRLGFADGSAGDIPVGLTVEIGHTGINQFHSFTGCRVSTLGITASSEGVAMFDVGFVGQDYTQSTSSLDAAPTSYTSTAIDHFGCTISEGGSSSAIVTDVSLNLDNGLDSSLYVIGSAGTLGDLPSGVASVKGSLTALFQNDVLLTKAENFTESALILTWTSGSTSLVLTVPELVYEMSSPAVSGSAGVKVNLNFTGYYANGGTSTALSAVLTNTVASY